MLRGNVKALASAGLLGILMLGGCAAESGAELEYVVSANEEALRPSGENRTFYTYRRDYRRCTYPMCGGAWVGRLNARRTVCADGTRAEECYVADMDWTGLGLDGDTESTVRGTDGVVLRGSIEDNVVGDRGNFGRFVATEAWIPATDEPPTGRVWRMEDNGIRCFTSPCFSLDGYVLNRRRSGRFSGLSLARVGASDAQIDAAYDGIDGEHGILVAGHSRWRYRWYEGWSRTFDANQLYLRATAVENDCVVGGCSSQLCGEAALVSTCEWRDEYACYRDATCERQVDGSCGWTRTPELAACMDEARVQICGTRGALPCAPDEFCDFPEAAGCGYADAPGTCQPRPDVCTDEESPVCGCDGLTYGNACLAAIAGTSVLRAGPCCVAGPHEASADEIEGDWAGTEEWEIEWSFEGDGSFIKRDLIAPCPVDVVCFWSGIVTNRGRWTVSGSSVRLAYDTSDTSFGVRQPDHLAVTTTCEHLVLDDGSVQYVQ